MALNLNQNNVKVREYSKVRVPASADTPSLAAEAGRGTRQGAVCGDSKEYSHTRSRIPNIYRLFMRRKF